MAKADLIWSLGLRDAIVDTQIFSSLPYRAGQQAALVVQQAALKQLVEVQRVAVGINAFWSSSRGNNPEGSYADLPPGCLWLMLVEAALDSGSAPKATQATVRADSQPSAKAASAPAKTLAAVKSRVKIRMLAKQPKTAYRPNRHFMIAKTLKSRTSKTATEIPALKTSTASASQTAPENQALKTSTASTSQTATNNPTLVKESPQVISGTSSEETTINAVSGPSRAAHILPWPTIPPHTFVRVPGSIDFTEVFFEVAYVTKVL